MRDALTTVEIQALRLKLLNFASHQDDRAVQIHCVAVDANLAKALDCQDDQTLPELARSVEQLDKAVRNAHPRHSGAEDVDNNVARLFDLRRDTVPLTAETPYGPRFQWLALDLQSPSRLG
jgi:hypothetical protein